MANNIAIDENNEVVHSSKIYNLRNKDRRVDARLEDYYCPHCGTSMTYSHSGSEGCFKHLPSTPKSIKESCPYYSGLLSGCSKDTALAIETKKKEVQLFLDKNEITGYKLIAYYHESNLVKYINKHPNEDFIMIGNMITEWEYDNFNGYLQLRKKALAKYISSNKKPIIQTFVGTDPDKIFLMKYFNEYYNDVLLKPFLLSISNLKQKDFSRFERLMEKSDIKETRKTVGKHDNRQMPTSVLR